MYITVLRTVLTRVGWTVVLLVAVLLRVQAEQVPHVSKCNFCTRCHVGDDPPAMSLRKTLSWRNLDPAGDRPNHGTPHDSHRQILAQPEVKFGVQQLVPSMFLATHIDSVPKQTLPNCTECYGCNTQLTHMNSQSKAFNITYVNEKGATSSWLFRATTNKMPGGQAVVKVYCLPIPKREGGKVPTCSPVTVQRNMKLYQALELLSEECGFTDILPKVWIDKVDSVMPEHGYHVRWYGLWMEHIQGVSLEGLLHRGIPHRMPQAQVVDLLQNKLNKTQVLRAAIFDLLTSQCDRHSQNIFIDEQGQLKLIDNEACLQNSWRNCAVDSIFIPTTQKQEIIRLSNEFVLKYISKGNVRKNEADPQLLLDYRCYLDNGKDELGTDYPPQITQCLKSIAAMTIQQVQEHYGFADDLPARNLHSRATDMLSKGFEWTFKYGEPRNAAPKRYLVQPKCCIVHWTADGYRCGHEWEPKFELPFGDPVTGREWNKERPDTGTFEGGTRYT